MTLTDIETNIEFEIWILPIKEVLVKDNVVSILKLNIETNFYTIIQNKIIKTFNLRDKSQSKDLDFYLNKGMTNLCQILQVTKDGSALLKVNFFNGPAIEMDKIEIGINDKVEESIRNQGVKYRTKEELNKKLTEKFILNVYAGSKEEQFFLMLNGQASDSDFNEVGKEVEIDKNLQSFSLQGDTIKIPIIKKDIDKKTIFLATKVTSKKATKNKESAIRLVKASLDFLDYTKTGRIRAIASGAMSKLINEETSYLRKWDEYGAIEGEMLLESARKVGKIEYINDPEPSDKGIELFFNEHISDRLAGVDAIEITPELPIYLSKINLTWDEYIEYLEEEFTNPTKKQKDDDKAPFVAKIAKIRATSIVLKSDDEDKISLAKFKGKFIILSINGEKVQIERRMMARKKVIEGRSANPQLGLIIEENGEIIQVTKKSNYPPLSAFVKEKIFSHNPTSIQKKAIEIALNTPDIALIQGPPGTGKTTVVTAIIEMLNEFHDKSKSVRGQILVTGFQHDAVENIISRLSINSLPTVKFGKSSAFSSDEVNKKQVLIRENIAKYIHKKNPKLSKLQEHNELSQLFNIYAILPSNNNAKNLLSLMLNLPNNILNKELEESVRKVMQEIKLEDEIVRAKDTIKTIRSLRIKQESFLDDGKEKSSLVYESFENDLSTQEQRVLKISILYKEGSSLDFLDDLLKIKIKLLDIYLPTLSYNIEKPKKEILDLSAIINNKIDSNRLDTDKKDRILFDFLYELENNPESIKSSIEDYSYVFSATTQQAEGRDIRKAKKKYKADEFLEYDTVIVDEAARVSPRDLLIPMTQAKKRIILVGDHRQLPHIIDEEIIKKMEDSEDLEMDENGYIQQSMFEYLFKRLKKLELKDNIQRTITLDAQYRMHPVLGKFVSDNFYKKHSESFKSPLEEKYFTQNLSRLQNKPMAWLDIPHNRGPEEKDLNNSRYRKSEAKAIASLLNEWINSIEGKNLTFGVISFYRAQANAVFDELSKYGITKNRKILKEYEFLNEDSSEERLRIGTVDSFQGMEFDVTFLSMVRTSNKKEMKRFSDFHKKKLKEKNIPITDELLESRVAISLFGHLISENRLCVSLSRQKKVLVIVGDGDLVNTDIAKNSIPALSEFYDLCKKEKVILNESN